ncbi:ubiquitin-conjugating enzyme/RWD-like protein [Filobasidium floriforme]|uniref:ubiquitin-conjugating enzyme/RWD-like protein n=1 Tax=Filobasidium floriforme TaxID=5210 RepID=UPI001E8D8B86|nr:ubiquitin-conjugating enzyme/RWD-like protein [Filobasidium floriforme]KAH8090527.1 ubiquitin-conjugating enzyme/RWD-like protein [Filobasidium floriforme]
MSGTAVRRVQKELGDIRKSPNKHIKVEVDESNVTHWDVKLDGPHGTPYQAGTYGMTVDFTNDYPFKPPVLKFTTKMYHPNIDSDGNICIGVLKTENWKPATKIVSVLDAMYELLGHPNPDDPLVTSIADQYRNDRPSFDKTVKEYINRYAK